MCGNSGFGNKERKINKYFDNSLATTNVYIKNKFWMKRQFVNESQFKADNNCNRNLSFKETQSDLTI